MGMHAVGAVFVVALAVSASACGSSATAPEAASAVCPTIAGNGSMCANIDGVAWTASNVANAANPVSCQRYPAGGPPTSIYCGGFDSLGHNLYFGLYPPTVGTHPLGPGLAGAEAGSLGAFNDLATFYDTEPAGASGTVTITTLTATQVAGTFSFTVMYVRSVLVNPVPAPAMHVITAGTFNITSVY